MRVYKFHTQDIPTGDMSHLRRQLLTGIARHVPMARLYEYCLPHKTSLVWRSGNPLWWRCDTYSVELTRVDSQTQLTHQLTLFQLLLSPFIPDPGYWQHLLMPAADPHRGNTLNGSLIQILVTLGHSAQNSNTCDVISNGISGPRIGCSGPNCNAFFIG